MNVYFIILMAVVLSFELFATSEFKPTPTTTTCSAGRVPTISPPSCGSENRENLTVTCELPHDEVIFPDEPTSPGCAGLGDGQWSGFEYNTYSYNIADVGGAAFYGGQVPANAITRTSKTTFCVPPQIPTRPIEPPTMWKWRAGVYENTPCTGLVGGMYACPPPSNLERGGVFLLPIKNGNLLFPRLVGLEEQVNEDVNAVKLGEPQVPNVKSEVPKRGLCDIGN